AITLVSLGYWISETRRAHALQLIEQVRERQETIRLLTEAAYKAMEAESAQRGFLVTGEQKYLPPLETGVTEARQQLATLRDRYSRIDPARLPVLESIDADLNVKAEEMR